MQESNYSRLLALGIDLKKSSGQAKVLCPKCSHPRKNKTEPCLSVNIDSGEYNCHNGCGFKGSVAVFKKPEKEYVKPVWMNVTSLPDNIVEYAKKRGISQRVLNEMGIQYGTEYMPQVQREASVIKFPYFMNAGIS